MVEATTTDLLNLYRDHADIRREITEDSANIRKEVSDVGSALRYDNAKGQSDIRRDVLKEASDTNMNVKTAGWQVSDRVGTEADRVVAQDTAYFIAGQQYDFQNAAALASLTAATNANFLRTQSDIENSVQRSIAATQLAGEKQAAAVALAGEKQASATALAQALLGQQIVQDGNSTRALINELKMDQLNREMIERNTALTCCNNDRNYWMHSANNAQFAAVTSQLNAFQSQLQETRQGMVNFGTMSGAAGQQTSTSNNVR